MTRSAVRSRLAPPAFARCASYGWASPIAAKAATPWLEERRRAELLGGLRHRDFTLAYQPAIKKLPKPRALDNVVAGAPREMLVRRISARHVQMFGAARGPAMHHRGGDVGM